jgi:hypothetical protein
LTVNLLYIRNFNRLLTFSALRENFTLRVEVMAAGSMWNENPLKRISYIAMRWIFWPRKGGQYATRVEGGGSLLPRFSSGICI